MSHREKWIRVQPCKLTIISLLLVFLFSFVVYFIAFLVRTAVFCQWNCIHHSTTVLRTLERTNPVLGFINKYTLLKIDLLPQKQVNEAYELLAFVDFVFSKYRIPYTIDSGTEMGAIRHGGFIPWDDDLDVIAFGDPEDIKRAFEKEISDRKLGEHFGYQHNSKVVSERFDKIRIFGGIEMDIFKVGKCLTLKNGKQIYTYLHGDHCKFMSVFPDMYFEHSDIFPIRPCKFGPLTVSCKNDVSKPYGRYYGERWMEEAVTSNHTFNMKRKKKFDLKKHKELLAPALPTNDAWKKWVDLKNNLKNKN